MRMFGSSGRGSAGRLSMPRIYSGVLLAHGRSSLKSAEAPGRSRNVSGPHLLWKRGNLSLSAVGSSFAASEEVQLIHLRFSPASVVDILTHPDAPPALVSHRLLSLSLSHTWTRGKAVIPSGSSFRRVLQRFRSVTTPRCVELTLLRQC